MNKAFSRDRDQEGAWTSANNPLQRATASQQT